MNYFTDFILRNFILLCVLIVVVSNSIHHYREQKKISFYSILIACVVLLLAIAETLERIGKDIVSVEMTTAFSLCGYILRPICIYLFILMSWNPKNKKLGFPLMAIPLLINTIIFMLALVPGVKGYVVEFEKNSSGTISFGGGPLRFASHIISALYLIFLIYVSIRKLKTRHLSHSIAILICALFIVAAVIFETFFDDTGELYLLNTTIAVSALTYYLYMYIEKTEIDPLTNLFNRGTYYKDLPKMSKYVTGVIQFDLNGLKYINDNFGHLEGDKALVSVSEMIAKCARSKMYPYRLGGDEFIIIAVKCSKEEIIGAVERFKELISNTKYHCSTGYSYIENGKGVLEMVREAEKAMYKDKEEFYKNSSFDRRK